MAIVTRAETQLTQCTSFIGECEEMLKVKEFVRRIAPADTTVFIHGESGVGKEVAARKIHELSSRARKPFVVVDCSAIPTDLMYRELFGHARGAFTNAFETREGLIEASEGGTLFMDQVEDMSLSLQALFLRVLENGEIRRIGETAYRRLNIRVVVATQANLRVAVGERRFREDLYYRLYRVPITIPPLRERGGDIRLLAYHFLEMFGGRSIEESGMALLQSHGWPGNVRELQAVMERAVFFANGETIAKELIQKALDGLVMGVESSEVPAVRPRWSVLMKDSSDEKGAFIELLKANRGNANRAARIIGVSARTIRNKIRKFGIQDEVERMRNGD